MIQKAKSYGACGGCGPVEMIIDDVIDERDAALARIDRLEAALKKYGYHRLDCVRFVPGSSGVCDCGWAEARAALKGEEIK